MRKTVAHMLEDKGSEVWSVGSENSVYEALEIMADKGVGALVVVDGNHLAGIISERDYARKGVLQERAARDTKVKDIMTAKVQTVTRAHSTGECMEIMTEKKIRHLPVIDDDGSIAGVISIGDVVLSVISEQEFLIRQLEQYITG